LRHKIIVEGLAFRLRPVSEEDAAYIVELRTDSRLNRFIHSTSPNIIDQLQWIGNYYDRPGDYYFIVESIPDRKPEGTVGIYSIDSETRSAEWGRWVLRPGSLAALESAWLIYRAGFDVLGLEMLYSRTVLKNEQVVAFQETIGSTAHGILPDFADINGHAEDVIEHRLTRANWIQLASGLERKVKRLSDKLLQAAD
jgi:RimJ/RimL family protein N-acetyltransferase